MYKVNECACFFANCPDIESIVRAAGIPFVVVGRAVRHLDAAMFFKKFLRMKAIAIVPRMITSDRALMTGEIP